MKQKNKNKKDINNKNKILILGILFLVFSILYYLTFTIFFTPKINIGIIGEKNIDSQLLEITKSGFEKNNYNKYFNVEIIENEKINLNNISKNISKKISSTKEFYLNSDFLKYPKKNNLFEKYNYKYDYFLIVVDKPILNYDEGSMGFWGEASPKYNSALITTKYFNSKSQQNISIIQNHAVHEIMHLLGYLHNYFDSSGIMQYKNSEICELVNYYKLQLPAKIFFSKYFKPQNFMINVYLKNLIIFPIVLFFIIGIDFITIFIFSKIKNRKKTKKKEDKKNKKNENKNILKIYNFKFNENLIAKIFLYLLIIYFLIFFNFIYSIFIILLILIIIINYFN